MLETERRRVRSAAEWLPAFDFRQTLVPAPVPGQGPFVYAQWVTLGSGPTWPGGVSEAIRCVAR